MNKESIKLGPVELQIKNFEEIKDFYINTIGLKILEESENKFILGDEENEILHIIVNPNLTTSVGPSVGLYHIAIVFPTQARLAQTSLRIYHKYPQLIEGTADHLATEAFYFHDPIGNGVELYFDKPRDQWPMVNGKPAMGSIYIDPDKYFLKHLNEKDNFEPLKVGHIHLKVNDIQRAEDFFVGTLKFDVIFRIPSALFVSYDNYHHHFGLNIWESAGASNLDPEIEGIKSYTIRYLDKDLFNQVLANIKHEKIDYKKVANTYVLRDPFGIKIKLIH